MFFQSAIAKISFESYWYDYKASKKVKTMTIQVILQKMAFWNRRTAKKPDNQGLDQALFCLFLGFCNIYLYALLVEQKYGY